MEADLTVLETLRALGLGPPLPEGADPDDPVRESLLTLMGVLLPSAYLVVEGDDLYDLSYVYWIGASLDDAQEYVEKKKEEWAGPRIMYNVSIVRAKIPLTGIVERLEPSADGEGSRAFRERCDPEVVERFKAEDDLAFQDWSEDARRDEIESDLEYQPRKGASPGEVFYVAGDPPEEPDEDDPGDVLYWTGLDQTGGVLVSDRDTAISRFDGPKASPEDEEARPSVLVTLKVRRDLERLVDFDNGTHRGHLLLGLDIHDEDDTGKILSRLGDHEEGGGLWTKGWTGTTTNGTGFDRDQYWSSRPYSLLFVTPYGKEAVGAGDFEVVSVEALR